MGQEKYQTNQSEPIVNNLQLVSNPLQFGNNELFYQADGDKEEIITLRENRGRLSPLRHQQLIALTVIDKILTTHTPYHDDNYEYLFENNTGVINKVDPKNKDLRVLFCSIGINPSENEYKYTFEELLRTCRIQGKKVTIHKFTYFDDKNFVSYIDNKHKVYRVTKDSIEVVKNGDNNILFHTDEDFIPFELVEIDKKADYIDKFILEKTTFDKEESSLTPEEQSLIIKFWMLCLFFESIMPTKPIVLFQGQKGSGKSMISKFIGKTLFGNSFNVTPLPNDEKDFVTIVTNCCYLVLDNVDTKVKWLNDKLASCATGQKIFKRELYTTNDMSKFIAKCFIAITSRTPQFLRDDIVDRLLPIYCKRIDEGKFIAESILTKDVIEHRNEIMTFIIRKSQDCLRLLELKQDETIHTSFRIADFATFCIKCAEVFSNREEIESIFDKLSKNQLELAVEEDGLLHALKIMLSIHGWENKEITPRHLFEWLSDIASANNIKDFKYESPRAIGRRLSNIKENIKTLIIFEKIKKRANKCNYRFSFASDEIRSQCQAEVMNTINCNSKLRKY